MQTNITNINLLALTMLGMLCFSVLVFRREHAIFPVVFACFYMTFGQRIVIIGFDFTIIRILLLFGWLRLLLKKEYSNIQLNQIDKLFLLWVSVSILTGTFLRFNISGFVNRMGFGYDAIGSYFFFRAYINNFDDVLKVFKFISFIIVPLSGIIFIEKTTGKNLFSFFGGVPEYTLERYGKLRCQGPFAHAILAGTFGATTLPFLVGLYKADNDKRIITLFSICSAIFIAVASHSSGPAISLIAAVGTITLWQFKEHITKIKWLGIFSLIALEIAMKAHVWHLIGRLSNLIGGTGWHRSQIIDAAIIHFSEWYLIGTTYTKHWKVYDSLNDPNMVDITNQFILEGVNGGILKLLLFIILLVCCFNSIGETIKSTEIDISNNKKFIAWVMGASLFTHTVSFVSVSYFDQMTVLLYMLFALIGSVSSMPLGKQKTS